VQEHVRHSGVEQESLLNDLTDHMCTAIEERLARGHPFETALNEVASLFGTNGLRQIQLDTFELLNEINHTMKKVAFTIGLASTTLLLAGTIFKLMHWPGANIMVLLGAAALVLGYFPLLLNFKIKESPQNERPLHVAGFIGITLTTLGVQFKIFHWPGAAVMLISGMAVLAFLYVPMFYYMRYKVSNNRPVTLSTGLVAMTCLILVFALMQVNNSKDYDRGIVAVSESLRENAIEYENPLYDRLANDPEAKRIQALTASTLSYLGKMRTTMVAEVEDVTLEQARTMSASDMKRVSNFDLPTHMMFGEQENMFFHDSIVKHLSAFRSGILATYTDSVRAAVEPTFPFDVEKIYPMPEVKQDWMTHWFFRVPMVGVLNQIAKLEYDVRQQEQQALLYLALRKN